MTPEKKVVNATLKFHNHTSSLQLGMLHYCSRILLRMCLKGNILVCYLTMICFESIYNADCYKECLKRSTLPGSDMFAMAMKNVNRFIVEKLANNEKMAKRYAD